MHTTLVTVHALAALLAAAAGARALARPRWTGAYLAVLAVSGAALAGLAVLAPSPGMRGVDLGLLALFAVAVGRAEQARRLPPESRAGSARHLAGIGFGLVTLADGFLVVAVLDLGGPLWAVLATALGVALAGHLLLRRRLGSRRPGPRPVPVRT